MASLNEKYKDIVQSLEDISDKDANQEASLIYALINHSAYLLSSFNDADADAPSEEQQSEVEAITRKAWDKLLASGHGHAAMSVAIVKNNLAGLLLNKRGREDEEGRALLKEASREVVEAVGIDNELSQQILQNLRTVLGSDEEIEQLVSEVRQEKEEATARSAEEINEDKEIVNQLISASSLPRGLFDPPGLPLPRSFTETIYKKMQS